MVLSLEVDASSSFLSSSLFSDSHSSAHRLDFLFCLYVYVFKRVPFHPLSSVSTFPHSRPGCQLHWERGWVWADSSLFLVHISPSKQRAFQFNWYIPPYHHHRYFIVYSCALLFLFQFFDRQRKSSLCSNNKGEQKRFCFWINQKASLIISIINKQEENSGLCFFF